MSERFVAAERVREDIKGLVPYDTHPFPKVIRMDANENPYTFPEEVVGEMLKELKGDTFTRYPDPGAVRLREALGEYNGISPGKIMVGNGSDEMIQLLYLTFGGRGRTVFLPVPTFSMFRIHARIAGTKVEKLPMEEGFRVPIEEILKGAEDCQADIIVLVTPNNPTGTVIPEKDLLQVLENTQALVVIDEAYYEFNRQSVVPYLEKYPNLVVLRTFSKAFGLAGMRVGYLVANEPVIFELNKLKQPFNVNSFSQIAAQAALRHREVFEEQIQNILRERERVFIALEGMSGVRPYPSQANFVLFKTPVKSTEVYEKLLEQGILIRDLGKEPGLLQDCLRVTVGKKEENDLFLEKLGVILAGG